jgi:hypothetical protein
MVYVKWWPINYYLLLHSNISVVYVKSFSKFYFSLWHQTLQINKSRASIYASGSKVPIYIQFDMNPWPKW